MPVSELALRSCKLFSDVPPEVLEQASQQMEIVQLRRREVLTYASKPFRGLGVVLQGRIQAIDQGIGGGVGKHGHAERLGNIAAGCKRFAAVDTSRYAPQQSQSCSHYASTPAS